MQASIISYDRCLGITHICDKFLDNSAIFPDKCNSGNIPCRYVEPKPRLESVQLPSDGLFAERTVCRMVTDVDFSNTFGYTGFENTLEISFGVKSHLELSQDFHNLQKVLHVMNTLFLEDSMHFSAFPMRFGWKFRLHHH